MERGRNAAPPHLPLLLRFVCIESEQQTDKKCRTTEGRQPMRSTYDLSQPITLRVHFEHEAYTNPYSKLLYAQVCKSFRNLCSRNQTAIVLFASILDYLFESPTALLSSPTMALVASAPLAPMPLRDEYDSQTESAMNIFFRFVDGKVSASLMLDAMVTNAGPRRSSVGALGS
jgi:hypothetical protein